MARKAASVLAEDPADRTAGARSDELERKRQRRPERRDEVWVLDEILAPKGTKNPRARTGAKGGAGAKSRADAKGGADATSRAGARSGDRGRTGSRGVAGATTHEGTSRRSGATGEGTLPSEVVDELAGAVGHERAQKLAERLAAAARAYERDRYFDAGRITAKLVDQVPESAAARELHGLVCYRQGRWQEAIRHLEAARSALGDDPSHLPVIMDCHRALGHNRRVGQVFDELRDASPPADVLVEGRLVMAAELADRGELDSAIQLLAGAGGERNLHHPGDRHVRQWYVLADLYERAGDFPRARELFARVARADPELADAGDRLAALGRVGRQRRGNRRQPVP